MERLTKRHCEVTVITAEEVQELAEQVRRVKEVFADSITVKEIVKSFIDFYVAYGDQNRMEDAILLTNEEALRHRELVERDTARKPDLEGDGYDEDGNIIYETWICPNCNEPYEIAHDAHDFCPRCGQKIDRIWENGSIRDMGSAHQPASFDDDIVSFMPGNGEYGNWVVIPLVREIFRKHMNDGWIPCEERLPTKEEYLKDGGRFILDDGNRRYQGLFDIRDGKFKFSKHISGFHCELFEDKCVIAWQPLPEPYHPEKGASGCQAGES